MCGADTGSSPDAKWVSSTTLREALADSEQLARFVVESRKEVESAVFETLAVARRESNDSPDGCLSTDIEVAFWHAYHRLAVAARPATVASVKARRKDAGKAVRFYRGFR